VGEQDDEEGSGRDDEDRSEQKDEDGSEQNGGDGTLPNPRVAESSILATPVQPTPRAPVPVPDPAPMKGLSTSSREPWQVAQRRYKIVHYVNTTNSCVFLSFL
jgi:hypothetical protein